MTFQPIQRATIAHVIAIAENVQQRISTWMHDRSQASQFTASGALQQSHSLTCLVHHVVCM